MNKISPMKMNNSELIKKKEEEINRISKELLLQREEILSQKEVIETQRDVAVRQRDRIEQQKMEITSSLTYASRIQSALMTREEEFAKHFSDFVVLYLPKDIVSGDFFWMHEKNKRLIIAAADATGHGVPGAFMSLMGIAFLNEIVESLEITEPDEILHLMSLKIIKALGLSGGHEDPSDGIDMALISIDNEHSRLFYSGAYNPVYILRKGKIIEIKAERKSVGFNEYHPDYRFSRIEFSLEDGDRIYMFTDGYIDQFGWRNNRKFMTRNFKQLLLEIQNVPLKGQKLLLHNQLNNWKGELEQTDDILVMGFEYKT